MKDEEDIHSNEELFLSETKEEIIHTKNSSENEEDINEEDIHSNEELFLSETEEEIIHTKNSSENEEDINEDEELFLFGKEERKIHEKISSIEMSEDEQKEFIQPQEVLINPYYEADPKVEGLEYKQSKFVTRGCSSQPKSYEPVCSSETHSCCKMDVYNWMKDIKNPFNENNFNITEVRFKNNRKEYFRLPDGLEITEGDVVAVEGNPGHDVGIVTLVGELCRKQMKKRSIGEESVKRLYRRAKVSDIEKWVQMIDQEEKMMQLTRKHILTDGLSMKLNDVELQGDGSKAVFYYTADDRVDFRNLIKTLAEEFKVRVEMKQIGVRQESGRLGGIGTCGRELCCSTWLTNFQSVNTSVAKVQQIALNPQKLAGQCGKLKCCLNYEYEVYKDAIKKFPDSKIALRTKKGIAHYIKTDIFRELMWYSYEHDNDIYALSITSIKEIIAMNERDELPAKIEDYTVDLMSKTDFPQESSDMEFDLTLLADVDEQTKEKQTVQRPTHTNERRTRERTPVQNGNKPLAPQTGKPNDTHSEKPSENKKKPYFKNKKRGPQNPQ